MSIGNPHVEEHKVFVDVIGVEISFGIPQDDLCRYLATLRGKVPPKGVMKVKGTDVIDLSLIMDTNAMAKAAQSAQCMIEGVAVSSEPSARNYAGGAPTC